MTGGPTESSGRTRSPNWHLSPPHPSGRSPLELVTTATPHPYLGMALPEWTLQQLVAYILGFSLQLASVHTCLCALQGSLTALSHLHGIQTPRLGTNGARPGSSDEGLTRSMTTALIVAAVTRLRGEAEDPGSQSTTAGD